MNLRVMDKVTQARKEFGIKDFPGNFFDLIISDKNYIEEHKLVLFKQDLDEISGFISYTDNNIAYICINYKDNIGHQNYTLAHEIGHFYLHRGESQNDDKNSLKTGRNQKLIEAEANDFAAELLYPIDDVRKHIDYIYSEGLLSEEYENELANYINDIAQEYCISFRFALLRILFNSQYKENNCVLEKVESVINKVKPLSRTFNEELHRYVENHHWYKPYNGVLVKQREMMKKLLENDEIGYDSANAIINKSNEVEGFDGTFI